MRSFLQSSPFIGQLIIAAALLMLYTGVQSYTARFSFYALLPIAAALITQFTLHLILSSKKDMRSIAGKWWLSVPVVIAGIIVQSVAILLISWNYTGHIRFNSSFTPDVEKLQALPTWIFIGALCFGPVNRLVREKHGYWLALIAAALSFALFHLALFTVLIIQAGNVPFAFNILHNYIEKFFPLVGSWFLVIHAAQALFRRSAAWLYLITGIFLAFFLVVDTFPVFSSQITTWISLESVWMVSGQPADINIPYILLILLMLLIWLLLLTIHRKQRKASDSFQEEVPDPDEPLDILR